jgi:serine/threonine protein kinase
VSGEAPVGTEIAGYRILSLLGRGAMGAVYLAEQTRLQRQVALKLLSGPLAEDPSFRKRFVRESHLASRLFHANIIPIYDAGEADGVLFISMLFVEGTDLASLIQRHGALPPERAMRVVEAVASALDEAHANGLVHRDVKPSNILIGRSPGGRGEEHVFLADFGLVKEMRSESRLTETGSLVGTFHYVAPEVLRGEAVDGRADVYSLACVLFECLTGQVPFERESEVGILTAHLFDAPPKVSLLLPIAPAAMDEVITTGLAKDPADRFQTCSDLADAARRAWPPIPAVPDSLAPRSGEGGRSSAVGAPPTIVTPPPPPATLTTPASHDSTGQPTPSAPASPAPSPGGGPTTSPHLPPRSTLILLSIAALVVILALAATVLFLRGRGTPGQAAAQSPTLAGSASAGAPPAGMLAKGRLSMNPGDSADLEQELIGNGVANADLNLLGNGVGGHVYQLNTYQGSIAPLVGSATQAACTAALGVRHNAYVDLSQYPVGSSLCVLTTEGNVAAVRIIGLPTSSAPFVFAYSVWK